MVAVGWTVTRQELRETGLRLDLGGVYTVDPFVKLLRSVHIRFVYFTLNFNFQKNSVTLGSVLTSLFIRTNLKPKLC